MQDDNDMAKIQSKLYATPPEAEVLPPEAQELLRALGQPWETPNKAELRQCRAMLGRQAEQLHHQHGEIRRLRSSPSCPQDLQLQKAEEPQSAGKRIAKEEIAFAEAEAEQMLQPLVAAREGARRDPLERLPSLDGDSSQAVSNLSASEIDTATAAGHRVLASLRRAREALELSPGPPQMQDFGPQPPLEFDGMTVPP